MKADWTAMIRLWILWVFIGLGSCSPTQEKVEVYSVLYDTTDPLIAKPKVETLWEYMDEDDVSKDMVFRYARLSDVDVNRVSQMERPAEASGLFSNAVIEKNRLDDFKSEFEILFNAKDSIGASHSAIFKPILSELKYLASLDKTQHKELIVYSNLMENSDWMSFYTTADLWLLEHKPSGVIERYMAQVPEDTDFSGVRVTIIYIPKDYMDNQQFKRLRQVYTQVFKKLGIPISFSANLVRSPNTL